MPVELATDDIYTFWSSFLEKVCAREATIYPALNQTVIRDVLVKLADQTRTKQTDTGPITQRDLSEAFFAVTGTRPTDESATMLQRLPSLGRISVDSPDRQFLDGFILNGLRAEYIINLTESQAKNNPIFDEKWIHPLAFSGLQILESYTRQGKDRRDSLIGIAKNASNRSNSILSTDIISALSLSHVEVLDYKGIHVSEGIFPILDFADKEVKNLWLEYSIIEKIDFTRSNMKETASIINCSLGTVCGVAKKDSLPEQVKKCSVDGFETLSTTQRIKKSNLSEAEKIFVEFLRKLFNQPGSGRKESALMRGMGESVNRKLSNKILQKMLNEKIISKSQGNEGLVYNPNRNQGARVKKILDDLTLRKDPLWEFVSNL